MSVDNYDLRIFASRASSRLDDGNAGAAMGFIRRALSEAGMLKGQATGNERSVMVTVEAILKNAQAFLQKGDTYNAHKYLDCAFDRIIHGL